MANAAKRAAFPGQRLRAPAFWRETAPLKQQEEGTGPAGSQMAA
jgi:hypothetical protein